MRLFDPHIHMTSRTTDDYQAMAAAGIVAIIEPAFWLGHQLRVRRDRTSRPTNPRGALRRGHVTGTRSVATGSTGILT